MFLNNWSNIEEMKKDFFEIYNGELEGINILLASYGTPHREGHAFVLFEKDGYLYEVNGTHCSCMGLEEQWLPEKTSIEALMYRLNKGNLGADEETENIFKDELYQVLLFVIMKNKKRKE